MIIKVDPDQIRETSEELTLQYLISKHLLNRSRLEKLQDYYEGRHDILYRKMWDASKPNNKIVNNLAAFISDTIVGYFMGSPVTYSANTDEDNAYLEALTDIFDDNDEQDLNAELAKGQSVQGVDYELLYTDEQAAIRQAELPAENVIYVESDDVAAEPLLAVRVYEVDDITKGGVSITDKKYYYDVYTDTEIVTYEALKQSDKVSLREIAREEHYFGEVPIIAYKNNKELLGDFEGVMTLIDAYNLAQSDTANDFEYFTDAYMVTTGIRFDSEDIKQMKENRVIGLPDKECSADWLIKQVNDTALENYKDRLRKDIHSLSKTPNLSDESFSGNLTGVAISYKIWGMDQIVSVKERKFKAALQRRIRLITNILNTAGKNWDYKNIDITFSRNMPQNLAELADVVTKLKGMVSNETLLSILPMVDDPQLEQDRLDEAKPTVDLDEILTAPPFIESEEDELEE
jgi:SPP1 family phage portal protein